MYPSLAAIMQDETIAEQMPEFKFDIGILTTIIIIIQLVFTFSNLSITAIKIITLIILFILIRIALICIKFITDLITKLPIISSINKIGGIAYGIIEGLFIIYLALAIAMAISTMTGNTDILIYINQSSIGKIMFNNNILLKIIFP